MYLKHQNNITASYALYSCCHYEHIKIKLFVFNTIGATIQDKVINWSTYHEGGWKNFFEAKSEEKRTAD